MANCSAEAISYPPRIAEFFHSFTHLNFYFDNVSSVFVPTLTDYQQVLFLYALGPCLFGGLVCLIFCGHFLASFCSCNKRHQRPLRKCVIALRCVFLFVSVVSSGFIIAAFVFNDYLDMGVKGVLTAVSNVNNSLIEIQSKVDSIKDDLVNVDSTIIDVSNCSGITDAEKELIGEVRSSIGEIVTSIVKIRKVYLPGINDYIQEIEYYRWWSTFGTLCMNTLTSIVMTYAILRRSRCGFILAVLLGIICLVLIWSCAGVDLAVVIGMSDLCVNPKATVNYYISDKPALKGVVRYYVTCPEDGYNPYQKYADKAKDHLEEASGFFSLLIKHSNRFNLFNITRFLTTSEESSPAETEKPIKTTAKISQASSTSDMNLPHECQHDLFECKDDLKKSQTSLSVIAKNLDCKYANQEFESSLCFVCYKVVTGAAELLLMSLIIGFLLIINLSLVLPILLRTPSSKNRKRRSVLDMCGSDTPLGTPYQSISEHDNRQEAVPLISSAPLCSTYNSIRRSSIEFHSFEDSWMLGLHNKGSLDQDFPETPQQSSPPADSFIANTNRGEITSMAF